MTPDELNHLKEELRLSVAETVRVVVNGKIDLMDKKLDAYIKEDTAWKSLADPYIKLASNISGAWRFLIYIGAGVVVFLSIKKDL